MALAKPKSLSDVPSEADIVKVISNLPSGWKVVGLTDLAQTGVAPPNVFTQTNQVLTCSANNGGLQQSNSNLLHLNNISPSNLLGQKLTGVTDVRGLKTQNLSLSNVETIKTSKEGTRTRPIAPKMCASIVNTPTAQTSICDINSIKPTNLMTPQAPATDLMLPLTADNKWTIVGVTPLPPQPDPLMTNIEPSVNIKDTIQQSHISLNNNNQTILKVPSLSQSSLSNFPTEHSPQILFNNLSVPNQTNVLHPPSETNDDASLMKWTVVGITEAVSSTTCPYIVSSATGKAEPAPSASLSLRNHCLVTAQSTHTPSKLTTSEVTGLEDSNKLKEEKLQNFQCDEPAQTILQGPPPVDDPTQSQNPMEWRVVGFSPLLGPPPLVNPLLNVSNPILPLLSSNFNPVAPSPTTPPTSTGAMAIIPTTSPLSILAPQTSCLNSLQAKSALPDPAATVYPIQSLPAPPPAFVPAMIPLPAAGTCPITNSVVHATDTISSACSPQQSQLSAADKSNTSQWKVVGLFTNDGVSVIPNASNTESSHESVSAHSAALTSSISSQQTVSKTPEKRSLLSRSDTLTNKTQLISKDQKEPLNLHTNIKREQSSYSFPFYKIKSFCGLSAKSDLKQLSKNTVSNLLKMKRSQHKVNKNSLTRPHASSFFISDRVSKTLAESVRSKRGRVLRSDHNLEEDETSSFLSSGLVTENISSFSRVKVSQGQVIKEERASSPTDVVDSYVEESQESGRGPQVRSPARRRKLKIPRKRVADLDYQPFDSSSDSN